MILHAVLVIFFSQLHVALLPKSLVSNQKTIQLTKLRSSVRYARWCNIASMELIETRLLLSCVRQLFGWRQFEPGKPLTFLDAHILHGDSLMGILDPEIMASGIPKEAYKHLTGRQQECLSRSQEAQSAAESTRVILIRTLFWKWLFRASISKLCRKTLLVEVERKRAAWNANLTNEHQARETLRANLFLAAFLRPKKRLNIERNYPHTQDLYRIDDRHRQRLGVEDLVQKIAKNHCFFHWHLAFAEIMQDGGFDRQSLVTHPGNALSCRNVNFLRCGRLRLRTLRTKQSVVGLSKN